MKLQEKTKRMLKNYGMESCMAMIAFILIYFIPAVYLLIFSESIEMSLNCLEMIGLELNLIIVFVIGSYFFSKIEEIL